MKKITLVILTALSCCDAIAQNCVPNSASLNFNGTSAYINLQNQNLNITDSITVEAWIYSTQWGTSDISNSIFCKHSSTPSPQGYVLRAGVNGQLSFVIRGLDAGGNDAGWVVDSTSGASGLTLNAWHHVAGTFDGSTVKVYVDGILKQSLPFAGTITPSTTISPRIGAFADPVNGPDRYFKGNIDEVRVWHRALTQTEIAAQMNNHIDTATATGLAGYWRFNEGTGAAVIDNSGHGNNGSLLSTIWATNIPFDPIPPIPIIMWSGTNITVNTTLAVQWYLNGNILPGDTTNTITPTQNGAYTVIVTNAAGCTRMSPPFNLTSAGIDNINTDNKIVLYPNPAHTGSVITMQLSQPEQRVSFEVKDVAGKVLISLNSNDNFTSKVEVSCTNLAKGIYIYHIQSAQINSTGKLIIN